MLEVSSNDTLDPATTLKLEIRAIFKRLRKQ